MSEELSAIANERVSRRVNARERKEAERYDTYSDGLRVREGDDAVLLLLLLPVSP